MIAGRARRRLAALVIAGITAPIGILATTEPAGAIDAGDEATFRLFFGNPVITQVDLTADISLTCTALPNDAALRIDGAALVVDGHGFTITQTCAGSGVLENISGLGIAGALTLVDVTIAGGTKTVSSSTGGINGGGVHSDTALTLNGALVDSNTVTGSPGGNGGGVAGGPVTIIDSTVSGNTAEKNAGGVYVLPGQPLEITRSLVVGNTATQQNGAGFSGAAQGTTDITDSAIIQNHALAGFAGGGFLGVGPNSITGSTFAQNDAFGDGGGAYLGGPTTVVNSTFSSNQSAAAGGGIFALDLVDLAYVTIALNTAVQGSGISSGDPWTSFGTVFALGIASESCDTPPSTSSGYNFEEGTNTCGFGGGPGDVVNGTDPLLAALGANGGPTDTRLPQAGSPLLDKIPASSPCAGVNIVVDQRGLPRPVIAGQFCDIGAVEVQVAAAPVVASPTFTG